MNKNKLFFGCVFLLFFISCMQEKNNLEALALKLPQELKREVVENKILHLAYSDLNEDPQTVLIKIFPVTEVHFKTKKSTQFWEVFMFEVENTNYEVFYSFRDIFVAKDSIDKELLLNNFDFETDNYIDDF